MSKEFYQSNQLAQPGSLSEAPVDYLMPPVAPYKSVVIHAPQAYEAAIGVGKFQGHVDDTINGATNYLKNIEKRHPKDNNPDQ